jgi:hypothetical protein
MATLFYAPIDTTPDNDQWIELGYTESCEVQYESDPQSHALIGFDPDGRCMSLSFSIADFSAYGYQVLFRRKHPRIKALRSAYRRKSRH